VSSKTIGRAVLMPGTAVQLKDVGAGVGDGVGDGVGAGVGDGVGDGVGAGVAAGDVGAGVGDGVGDGVGAGVAAGHAPWPSQPSLQYRHGLSSKQHRPGQVSSKTIGRAVLMPGTALHSLSVVGVVGPRSCRADGPKSAVATAAKPIHSIARAIMSQRIWC